MRQFTTPSGMCRLRRRLTEALARYDAIVATNPEAAESGDNCVWHDNFAYEENQRQMHAAGRTIHDLRRLLANIIVLDLPAAPTRVGIGTSVEVMFTDTERCATWEIAGFDDGDPDAGRISYTAPLARALLGAEPGDERTVGGGARRTLEIISIDAIATDRNQHPRHTSQEIR